MTAPRKREQNPTNASKRIAASLQPFLTRLALAMVIATGLNISGVNAGSNDDELRKRLQEFERQTRVDKSLTIAEVANMAANKQLGYVHSVASRRGLELGIKHGDEVLKCLGGEFHGAKKNPDGSFFIPRGMEAAIQLIHRHNNNGGESRLAAKHINHFVDLVAEHACGVKP